MSDTPDLGVAICAHNSQRTIGQTIRSVEGLARRVIVVDSGSTDDTIEVCRSLGAQVIQRGWAGHVAQKQFSIDQCRQHKWILLLDSDESAEPALRDSIRGVMQMDDPAYDGWSLNRKIWFMGGWLHYTYQPEWRLRLFRSGKGRVAGRDPHDRIDVDGRIGKLKGDLRHDPWTDMTDMAMRHLRYAQIACTQTTRGGSLLNILFNPPAAIVKQLVLKRGLLDGWRGVVIAGMTANSILLKHAFIAAHKRSTREDSSS